MELAVPAQFYPIHICIPRKSQSLWKTYVGDGMESGIKISRGPMPYTLDHLPIESNLHIHEFELVAMSAFLHKFWVLIDAIITICSKNT